MADLTGMMQAAAGVGGEEADEYFQNTVLLLHGDGINGQQNNVFLDSSSNAFAITRNGDTTQGTFSPFSKPDGAWGNYFDGTGDYLTVPDNGDLDLGTGDFCVEFFWYPQSTNAAQYLLIGDSTGDWYVIWESGNLSLGRRAQGNDVSTTGFTLAQNTWQHICVTRQSTGTNDTRIFVNGVLYGVGTSSQNYVITTTLAIGSTQSATNPITGYLSNVRVIKGSVPVEYQTASTTTGISIFTPPTSALTAVSGTELLICQSNRFVDNSANAFAITVAGDTKVTPFSPFPLTTEYSPSVNGGSGYFDGSGDYLAFGPTSTIGTSSFTIEAWVYFTLSPSSRGLWGTDKSTSGGFTIRVNSTTNVTLDVTGGGGTSFTVPTININEWTHIACVRDSSNNTTVFVNGQRASTGAVTVTTSFDYLAGLGLLYPTTQNPVYGYIASARILTGSAIYDPTQTTCTVPTLPLTAVSGTQFLCNFTNSGILDNTCFNDLITVGNAAVNTTTKKYGTGSMEFDGTGDELVTPYNPALALGGGDFTLECWIYPITNNFYNGIYQNYTDGNGRATALRINTNNTDQTSLIVQTQASALITTSTGVVTASAWNHIALVRNGSGSNNLVLYVNGTSAGTATNTTNFSDGIAQIGNARYAASNYYFNGLIDDLRLTVGIARYTTTFTPPTAAFPNIGE